jgi:hypothetical protein
MYKRWFATWRMSYRDIYYISGTYWTNLQKTRTFRQSYRFSQNLPLTCKPPANNVRYPPLYKGDVTLLYTTRKNSGTVRKLTGCNDKATPAVKIWKQNFATRIMLTANCLARSVTCDYNIATVSLSSSLSMRGHHV